MFLKSECDFIRIFPVTILACGNYYTNNDKVREIDSIYDVTFDTGGERIVSLPLHSACFIRAPEPSSVLLSRRVAEREYATAR